MRTRGEKSHPECESCNGRARTRTHKHTHTHLPVVEIVGIIAKRIVEFNGHQLQSHEAVREQKDDKAVCNGAAVVGNHDKGYGVNIQKEKRPTHLD